ncbi:hypothetical protein H2248_010320 [Termitomyces sp. 'cryptogamus']|nr:hypothetical protein H2248_010320 [Termitomyces sp. 'cryptogamus']
MLFLRDTSVTVKGMTALLDAVVSKLVSIFPPAPPQAELSSTRTWVAVAHSHLPLPTLPSAFLSHPPPPKPLHSQMNLLPYPTENTQGYSSISFQNLHSVLVSVNHNDDNVPKDTSSQRMAKLRECLNKALANLDSKALPQKSSKEEEVTPPHPST